MLGNTFHAPVWLEKADAQSPIYHSVEIRRRSSVEKIIHACLYRLHSMQGDAGIGHVSNRRASRKMCVSEKQVGV